MKRNYIVYALMSLICINNQAHAMGDPTLFKIACAGISSSIASIVCFGEYFRRTTIARPIVKPTLGNVVCASEVDNQNITSDENSIMYKEKRVVDVVRENGSRTRESRIINDSITEGSITSAQYNSLVEHFNKDVESYNLLIDYSNKLTLSNNGTLDKKNRLNLTLDKSAIWNQAKQLMCDHNNLCEGSKSLSNAINTTLSQNTKYNRTQQDNAMWFANMSRNAGYATGLFGIGCLGTYCYFKYYKNN